jgi:putative endonuclease
MAHVYILQGENKRYYIGSTSDLERRVAQHQSGHTHSTHRMGQVKVVFSQEYATLEDARAVEGRLKKLKRRDYIERIIEDGIIRMKSQ